MRLRSRNLRVSLLLGIALAFLTTSCGGETAPTETVQETSTSRAELPSTTIAPLPTTTTAPSTGAPSIAGDFDIGGRSLYLECVGQGSPTVILEAGMTGDLRTWIPVQTEIAKTTRVCSYDRAGIKHGGQDPRGSDPAPIPRPASAVTNDLHALLEGAGVEPPYVLVGFSFGGLFAQHFAATYPDEISGLMLIESNHFDEARQFEEHLTSEQIETDRQEVQNLGEGIDVYASFDEVAAIVDLVPDVPLVVLTGDAQGDWPPGWDPSIFDALRSDQQADLVLLTSQGRQVIVENSGHFVVDDRPDVIIVELKALLAEIGPE